VIYAVRHPALGVVEADDLDFEECLAVARPYLGPLVGAYTDWTPLQGRGELFDEELDPAQPWQLRNVRARQWRA
jgi:homospermidine synthase